MTRNVTESKQTAELQADFVEFEERCGMSSETFCILFQTGQTDDRIDFMEWASPVQMADNLRDSDHT